MCDDEEEGGEEKRAQPEHVVAIRTMKGASATRWRAAGRLVCVDSQSLMAGHLDPLLAWPAEVLEPSADASGDRDERETRMPAVRAVLRALANSGDEALASLVSDDPAAKGSIGTRLSAVTSNRAALQAAVMNPAAKPRARVYLWRREAERFAPAFADGMPEFERVQCLALRGDPDGSVAVCNWPQHLLPRRCVHVRLQNCREFGGSADATIELRPTGECGVELDIFSTTGQRTHLHGRVPKPLLTTLFAAAVVSETVLFGVPKLLGELPVDLMSAFAHFWQEEMRAHVVASVCAPRSATRPLVFQSVTANFEGAGPSRKRIVVRGTLHPSSVVCACKLWQLTKAKHRWPQERFAGSEVQLVLSMCGHGLHVDANGASHPCGVHGSAGTPEVAELPSVCCADTIASLTCTHFTEQRKVRKVALHIRELGHLKGLKVLHARVLLAAAARCLKRVNPMICGKRPATEVMAACGAVCAQMRRDLDEVTRQVVVAGASGTDAEMLERDMRAHDLLASSTRVYQKPRSAKSSDAVLVRRALPATSTDDADGADEAPSSSSSSANKDKDKDTFERLKAPFSALATSHVGFFEPLAAALAGQKRARDAQ